MNAGFFKKQAGILILILVSPVVNAQKPVGNEQGLYSIFSNTKERTGTEEVFTTAHIKLEALLPVDFSAISPYSIYDWLMDRPAGQGANHDIDYYIGHFHQLANSVLQTGTNQGFIDIAVWRNPEDNEPYNARVMENITTLAWFYTREESWNPYYAHPDLRSILEAALTFWVNMQNSDGRFSEYGYNSWNLAATAFATKFMGKTLEMLEDGPPIDPVIFEQVKLANRKALMVVFTNESLYNQGKRFSNQYGNAFTGALAHLDINPDDNELREAFESRLETSLDDFQSPAGYFYENYGPDWSYAFGTHHSNILMAWHYARNINYLAEHYLAEHQLFIDWLSYNAVIHPCGSFFMLNRSIESRQSRPILTRLESPFSEVVPLARAFNTTQEEASQRLIDVRQRVTSNWGNIPALQVGNFNGYSAYTFLHHDHYRSNPTEAQRQEAVASLPYLASDNFIHQRADDQFHFEVTFVRKPSYYAAFSAGDQVTTQQRFGLGLLWNPLIGTVLQSQSRSSDAAWGTVMHPRTTMPWESLAFEAVYKIDGMEVEPEAGAQDLANGVLEITYSLGSTGIFSGIGEKKLTFYEDVISVDVYHQGDFTEILPLVLDANSNVYINHENGMIQIFQDGVSGYEKLRIEILNPQSLEATFALNKRNLGNGMSVKPIHIQARDSLFYTIKLNPQVPLSAGDSDYLVLSNAYSFQVKNSYPNPARNNSVVSFDIDFNFNSDIKMEVFDMMGRMLLENNFGILSRGRHTVSFNIGNLTSGIYLVRLNASGHIQFVPIMVMK